MFLHVFQEYSQNVAAEASTAPATEASDPKPSADGDFGFLDEVCDVGAAAGPPPPIEIIRSETERYMAGEGGKVGPNDTILSWWKVWSYNSRLLLLYLTATL